MILNKKLIQKLFLLSILSGIFINTYADDANNLLYTKIIANNSTHPWTILFSISSSVGLETGYLDQMSDCHNQLLCTIAPGERKTIHYVVQSDRFNGTVSLIDTKDTQKTFVISPYTNHHWFIIYRFYGDSYVSIDETEPSGKAVSLNTPDKGSITINCNDWHCSPT